MALTFDVLFEKDSSSQILDCLLVYDLFSVFFVKYLLRKIVGHYDIYRILPLFALFRKMHKVRVALL